MSAEPRYVMHLAALDAALYLSILASHSSKATQLKRAAMSVAFENIGI